MNTAPVAIGSINKPVLLTTGVGEGVVIPQIRGIINSSGSSAVVASSYSLTSLNSAPASSSATGTLGEIRFTSTYIYVCTATNTWVRAALATW